MPMEAIVSLEAEEACEAVRAYLVLRGALPAHGKVTSVEAEQYSAKIKAKVEIGQPVQEEACNPVP
jgi:hypothetical protein